jgi:hypothetical protein
MNTNSFNFDGRSSGAADGRHVDPQPTEIRQAKGGTQSGLNHGQTKFSGASITQFHLGVVIVPHHAQGKFPLKKSRQKQGCLKARLKRARKVAHVVWFPASAPRDGRSFASDFCDDDLRAISASRDAR